ncbi:hypothetical protein GQR58_002664 [Nymphon striatum]|nr:hypothetical protein GQR58_002664 [Nymphon striatum]
MKIELTLTKDPPHTHNLWGSACMPIKYSWSPNHTFILNLFRSCYIFYNIAINTIGNVHESWSYLNNLHGNFQFDFNTDNFKLDCESRSNSYPPGDDVMLECAFDMHNLKLYSIKWYKDGEEFYRYLPKLNPPRRRFENEGINVNLSMSDKGRVLLQKVDFDSTGTYKCEVSAERPGFHTKNTQAKMTIYVEPASDPVISGFTDRYRQGEMVGLNCTSAPSKPAANITWLINGREVVPNKNTLHHQVQKPSGDIENYVTENADGGHGLDESVSTLQFFLSSSTFIEEKVEVVCRVNMFDVYNSSTSVFIQIPPTISDSLGSGNYSTY